MMEDVIYSEKGSIEIFVARASTNLGFPVLDTWSDCIGVMKTLVGLTCFFLIVFVTIFYHGDEGSMKDLNQDEKEILVEFLYTLSDKENEIEQIRL